MKYEATRLTKAQTIVVLKISMTQHVVLLYCAIMFEDVEEIMEMVWIGKEPPIDDGIQPIQTFAEHESATDFKGFEALHNIVLDVDNQLLCYDVQT